MSTNKPLHVIIAGGGIGGLALAQGLRKAGVSVAVYERDRHRTDRVQGFRIHINPHGSYALHDCLPPELFDAFVASGGKGGNEFGFITEQMKQLLDLDEEITTGGLRDPKDSHYGISRITLRQILLAGLDDIVHYDKMFERYEREADGQVTAHFADGTSATGDVLVAADGGTSRVRQQYLPHAERVETGIVTIAGKFALTDEGRARLAPRFVAGPLSVMPPKGCGMFIAPHEFSRPTGELPTGIGGNDAVAELHPGALFDNTQPYVFWAFAAKRESYPGRELESLTGGELQQLALTMMDGWAPQLRRLVSESDADTVILIPIRTSVPVQPWQTTNITLLGDAIHSMTPFRGIGANTALRDAQLLCRKLIAAERGERPLLDGIHEYEAEMIDYGFAAVKASLKTAQMAVGDSRAARIMAKTVFRTFNALPALKRKVFAGFGDA